MPRVYEDKEWRFEYLCLILSLVLKLANLSEKKEKRAQRSNNFSSIVLKMKQQIIGSVADMFFVDRG